MKKGNEDPTWKKNFELMMLLENIICHYNAERYRNYDLRMASIKEFIPFSVVSNCISYGPLLIELVYHQATFQPKYKDLIRHYFSYPVNDSKSSKVYVGWDAVAEDTNLKCGQFRHKRQSIEQSITQSQVVDTMDKEIGSIEQNLGIKNSVCSRTMKDDRETKSRLIMAILCFKSFEIQSQRDLINEFSVGKEKFNRGVLKETWLPTAQFLMQRYVNGTKDQPICQLSTDQRSNASYSKDAMELLKKIKQSKSTVTDVKPIQKDHLLKSKAVHAIKRKTKAFQDDLLWQNSPFQQAAAICHHDGTKIYPSKAKFRNMLIKHFSKVTDADQDDLVTQTQLANSLDIELTDIQRSKIMTNAKSKCIIDEDTSAWINDVQLANAICLLKTNLPGSGCRCMYPLPHDGLEKILSGEAVNRKFSNAVNQGIPYVIPFSDRVHWRVLLLDSANYRIYHFDSLGGTIPHAVKDSLVSFFPSIWKLTDIRKCYQADGYQYGIWVYIAVKCFLRFLQDPELRKTKEFAIESYEPVSVLDGFDDQQNDLFISRKRRELKKELELACLENELAFLEPQSEEDQELTDRLLLVPEDENMMKNETEKQKSENNEESEHLPNVYYKFPSGINFTVASVDAQHTLWERPDAANGKDYISFLNRRHWNYYFKSLGADTLYWNYDLGDIIHRKVPKSDEQTR